MFHGKIFGQLAEDLACQFIFKIGALKELIGSSKPIVGAYLPLTSLYLLI
jgi:hypothetical protein